MMTTDRSAAPVPGTPVRIEGLGAATVSVAVLGLLAALLGLVLQGSPQAVGALAGAGLVVAFFCFGAVGVNLVAAWAPRVSLVFALLTYTLQVLLLAAVLVGLARSELVPDTLDPRWLGGTTMVATLVWMAALLRGALRAPLTPVPGPLPGPSGGVAEGPAGGPGESPHEPGVTR